LATIAGLLALFLLVWLVLSWLGDARRVFDILGQTAWRLLLPSAVVLLLAYALHAWRWQQALAASVTRVRQLPATGLMAAGGPGRHLADGLAVMGVSSLLAILTPLPDVSLKVVTTGEATDASMTEASTAVVVERLLMILVRLITLILAVALLAAGNADSLVTILLGAAVIIAALGLTFWIVLHPHEAVEKMAWLRRLPYSERVPLEKTVANMVRKLAMTAAPGQFARSLAIYALIWLLGGLFHLIVLAALPVEVPIRTALTIAAALLVVLPPATPTMVGIYQGVGATLLTGLRLLDSNTAVAYVILLQIPQIVCWLGLGLWGHRYTDLHIRELLQQARSRVREQRTSHGDAADKEMGEG
jgi:hypothetical protein